MSTPSRFFAAHMIYLEELGVLREQAGLSCADLASRLGVQEDAVFKGEAGLRRIDVVELQMWAAACGSSLTEFMARVDERLGRVPARFH